MSTILILLIAITSILSADCVADYERYFHYKVDFTENTEFLTIKSLPIRGLTDDIMIEMSLKTGGEAHNYFRVAKRQTRISYATAAVSLVGALAAINAESTQNSVLGFSFAVSSYCLSIPIILVGEKNRRRGFTAYERELRESSCIPF